MFFFSINHRFHFVSNPGLNLDSGLSGSQLSLSSSLSSHALFDTPPYNQALASTPARRASSASTVQRSQSTNSKRSLLPSLSEKEKQGRENGGGAGGQHARADQHDNVEPYENHSIIMMHREEIKEETEEELNQVCDSKLNNFNSD